MPRRSPSWISPNDLGLASWLALYIMPLQIAVLSRFPLLFGPRMGTMIVVLYSLAIEFVWLNFAAHAQYWIPYQVYPLF